MASWESAAVKHPGAETAAAKKAGKPLHAFEEAHEHDSGKAGERARFGLLMKRLAERRKHGG